MPTTPNLRDGKETLLAIVNVMENMNVNVNDVDFSDPVKVLTANPVRNTTVKITGKNNSGYYGVKTIWYDRIHISELGTILIDIGSSTRYAQLLPAINEKYGLFLADGDIIDGPLPTGSTGEIEITLPISPTSFKFYDGSIVISQNFDPGVPNSVLVPAKWDSNVKSTYITVDPSGYDISAIPGFSMIRTNMSFVSNKRYFEFTNYQENGLIGFGTALADTNVLIGSDDKTWAIDTYTGLITHSGVVIQNISPLLTSLQDKPIGVLLDLENHLVTLIIENNIRVDLPNIQLPLDPIFILAGNGGNTPTDVITRIYLNSGQDAFVYTVPPGAYPGFGSGGVPMAYPAGSLISQACVGVNMVGTYSNGYGSTYTQNIEVNSLDCGYIPPPVTLSTTTPTLSVLEGNNVEIIYELDTASVYDLSFDITIGYDATASIVDHDTLQLKIGTDAYAPIVGSNIIIPIGATTFSIKFSALIDGDVDPNEVITVSLEKTSGSATYVTNNIPLVTTITITE